MGNSSDNKNIEKLCEELGIDEFVKAFDNGYDTVIGERGAKTFRRAKAKNCNC